jgi:putative ABC transport system permease protein
MLRNNLRIAIRTLWKKRVFTFINVAGLAIGLSAVLIIVTYIREELGYDTFHANYKTIFRITEEYKDDVQQIHSATNHGPLVEVLNGRLTGLNHAVRILPYPAYVSADKISKYRENNLVFADSTFFNIFSFTGISGDPANALTAPFSVVLTRSIAMKYFNRTDVTGRELFYEDERGAFTFYITAVVEDVPQNSHFRFDLLFNMSSLHTVMPWFNNWHYPPMYIYIQTDSNIDAAALQKNIQVLAGLHQPQPVKDEKRKYNVQPLGDIHLYSDLAGEWQANAKVQYIKIFGGIAAFLLLIACINFMNLSTAQAAQRAREVGVRKVLGAFRKQLVRQFMGEALLISLGSLIIALGLAELLLMTFFKGLFHKDLSLIFLVEGYYLLCLPVLLIFIALLAGLYPSFYLSRFSPALTLKGKTEEANSILGVRRGLVVFQFFVSGLLIFGTIVVLRQVDLLKYKHLGFDQEHLVTLRMTDRFSSGNYKTLKENLLRENKVISVALSSEIPGGAAFHGFEVNPEGFARETMSMKTLGMDEDFLSTYNLQLVSGRGFSEEFRTDGAEAFVLNEAAVRFLGWTPESAIGKAFELVVFTNERDERKGKVVGVVRDFNFESLHHAVEPLVLYINKHVYYSDYLTVRVRPGDVSEMVTMLEQHWKTFHPEKPLDFFFLNDRLKLHYKSEMQTSTIFTSFAVLSVIISSLGLFGLSVFSAQRKTKEIGIRKVLGASVSQIIKLLSIEYVIMISAANLLAWPLAFYLTEQWLGSFPYRVAIGVEMPAVSLAFALIVTLITISIQSVKAALINPVNSLKNE